ncbi:MAG: stage V sporulation protein S [Candidatus Bipolaricaulota bacterium]
MTTLKVSTNSNPSATAGAIAAAVRKTGGAEIHVIGPRAVNQAVKAIAIARGYVAPNGLDLYCTPSFSTLHVGEGEEDRTGIVLSVRPRIAPADGEPGSPADETR